MIEQGTISTLKPEKPQANNTYLADDLLTTSQLSKLIGRSNTSLERDRRYGIGIPYITIGKRSIRYRYSDVIAYLEKQRINTQN